jgi:hypothetical protein
MSFFSIGPLAQLVEQQAFNLLVLRSSRRRPTILCFAGYTADSSFFQALISIIKDFGVGSGAIIYTTAKIHRKTRVVCHYSKQQKNDDKTSLLIGR